jgi:hypothetical protein
MTDDPIEDLVSAPLTDAERYYLEQAYKDPVERIGRIEDVAKFLAGATAATSGLYLAAFKIAFGGGTVSAFAWFLPYLLWAVSLVFFVLVLLPHRHPTRENDPGSWRAAFIESGKRKYIRLMIGTVFFILGILAGGYPFHALP